MGCANNVFKYAHSIAYSIPFLEQCDVLSSTDESMNLPTHLNLNFVPGASMRHGIACANSSNLSNLVTSIFSGCRPRRTRPLNHDRASQLFVFNKRFYVHKYTLNSTNTSAFASGEEGDRKCQVL
jgi:hypothetical protein